MKIVILWLVIGISCVQAATLQEYIDYSKGKSLYSDERYDEAEEKLKSALEHGEEVSKLYRGLGDVAYQKGDYEQSIKFYDQSLLNDTQGDDVDLHYNKGNSYLKLQQFDKAADEYKTVLAKDPTDQSAKKNLEIALRLIQEQQNQDQSSNDDKDKNKDQNQQDQQDQNKPENNNDNNENNKQQNEPQRMEEEQAKQILKMIEENESDVRKQYRKKPEEKGTIDNDW